MLRVTVRRINGVQVFRAESLFPEEDSAAHDVMKWKKIIRGMELEQSPSLNKTRVHLSTLMGT